MEKYYDPEYDKMVDEDYIKKQYDYFAAKPWFHKDYETFKKDNFYHIEGDKDEEIVKQVMGSERLMKQSEAYLYFTKHGLGPGTLPKDVNVIKAKDLDNYMTAIWLDRFLTTKELDYYDIYPETRNNDFIKKYGMPENYANNKKSQIKEGFIGQTLEDFLNDLNNKTDITIWCYDIDENNPVYEGDHSEIPQKYLDAQFDDFEIEGRLFVNISDVENQDYNRIRKNKNKCNIFESLTDDDIEKLGKYTLEEDELSHLLSLLELIDDDNKLKAFELIDALFSGKKLVPIENETSEGISNNAQAYNNEYTRRLLGDM